MVTVYWSNTCWQSRKIQGTALLLLIPTLFACQATGTWLPGISYSLPKWKLLQENKVLGSPGVFVVQLLSFAENPSFKAYLKSPAGRRLFILWRVFLKMTDNLCFSVQRKKKKKRISSPPKTTPVLKQSLRSQVKVTRGSATFFPSMVHRQPCTNRMMLSLTLLSLSPENEPFSLSSIHLKSTKLQWTQPLKMIKCATAQAMQTSDPVCYCPLVWTEGTCIF